MHFREIVFKITVDIEHLLKVHILSNSQRNNDDDGYQIVEDFLLKNPDIHEKLKKYSTNSYNAALIQKYQSCFPLWVFVEIIPFGDLIKFYNFYISKYPATNNMSKYLWSALILRNAAAHNSCVLNRLSEKFDESKINNSLMNTLKRNYRSLNPSKIKKYLLNPVIQDFIGTLILLKKLDKSKSLTEDYIGPEIDIGFIIGKYTFAGIIVVSLELAYILLDAKLTLQTTERIRVIDTGWEVLKGVWEGKRYPIFWLDLPEQYDTNGKEINYTPYTQWDIEENKHVKNYAAAKENSKYERDSDLRSIIQSLPKSFDVNIPYFITDEDEFSPEHKERLEFINIVNEVTQTNKEQNKSKKKSKNMNSIDKIMDLVDGALTKNRHPDN